MLYPTIIVVNVLSLFFQIYNIKGVENKHSLFLSLDSLCRRPTGKPPTLPARGLIFEIGQSIINVNRFSRFSPNNYVMKHNGAILYQLYLHVVYYLILRKK